MIKSWEEYLNYIADSSGEFSITAARETLDVSIVTLTQTSLHYSADTQHRYNNVNH